MLAQTLKSLYHRDIEKLKKELEAYKNEKAIWVIDKNIANSAGTLFLHLIGNLNTFIGKELGNTGYVRNRDLEFSQRDVPRSELLKKLDELIEISDRTFDNLSDEQLRKEYPVMVYQEKQSTQYVMISILAHLDYHLGQINYHRRLLDTE